MNKKDVTTLIVVGAAAGIAIYFIKQEGDNVVNAAEGTGTEVVQTVGFLGLVYLIIAALQEAGPFAVAAA